MGTLKRILFGGNGWISWDRDDLLLRCDRFELSLRAHGFSVSLWCRPDDEKRRISAHLKLPRLFSLFVRLPFHLKSEAPPDEFAWQYGILINDEAIHIEKGWKSRLIWWPWRNSHGYEKTALWHRKCHLFDPWTGKTIQAEVEGQREVRRYHWIRWRKTTYCAWVNLAEEAGPRVDLWKGGTLGFGVSMNGRREAIDRVLMRAQERMWGLR